MIVYLSALLCLLPMLAANSEDLCQFVDEDYCFYFGTSSCYQKICECEQIKCEENCTLPVWCSYAGHLDVNETSIHEIPLDCPSLKENCISQKYFNGYCFFYKKRKCPSDEEVEQKSKQFFVVTDKCPEWKATCARKWSKHHACRMFRKHCKKQNNETDIEFSNSTHSFPNHHGGQNWEKNMKNRCRKWRQHCNQNPKSKDCAKVENRCSSFNTSDLVVDILNATGTTFGKDHGGGSHERGPNWERNMQKRCKHWRSACKKDPSSSACGRVKARCPPKEPIDPTVSLLNDTAAVN